MIDAVGKDPLDPGMLGRRLVEVCRLCDEGRARMTPDRRDAQLQLFLTQGMGLQGRFRATLELCEAGMAIRRARQQEDGTNHEPP